VLFYLFFEKELEKLNNFNSLMAVMAGVNSAAILRLKETKQLVASKNKILVDQFAQLENLMSSERYSLFTE
jgi:ribonuclease HIII